MQDLFLSLAATTKELEEKIELLQNMFLYHNDALYKSYNGSITQRDIEYILDYEEFRNYTKARAQELKSINDNMNLELKELRESIKVSREEQEMYLNNIVGLSFLSDSDLKELASLFGVNVNSIELKESTPFFIRVQNDIIVNSIFSSFSSLITDFMRYVVNARCVEPNSISNIFFQFIFDSRNLNLV